MKLHNKGHDAMTHKPPVNGILTVVENGKIVAFIKNKIKYVIPKGKTILQVFKRVDKIKTKKQ